jgi:hypothetical protein
VAADVPLTVPGGLCDVEACEQVVVAHGGLDGQVAVHVVARAGSREVDQQVLLQRSMQPQQSNQPPQ